jgi:hypothetical protein
MHYELSRNRQHREANRAEYDTFNVMLCDWPTNDGGEHPGKGRKLHRSNHHHDQKPESLRTTGASRLHKSCDQSKIERPLARFIFPFDMSRQRPSRNVYNSHEFYPGPAMSLNDCWAVYGSDSVVSRICDNRNSSVRGDNRSHALNNDPREREAKKCRAQNMAQDRTVSGHTASRIPQRPAKRKDLRELAFPNPGLRHHGMEFFVVRPPIESQRQFNRGVTVAETLKKAHRASLAEPDAMFALLQHRAFRGEL